MIFSFYIRQDAQKNFFFDIVRTFFVKKEGFCFYFIKFYIVFHTYFTNISAYYAK